MASDEPYSMKIWPRRFDENLAEEIEELLCLISRAPSGAITSRVCLLVVRSRDSRPNRRPVEAMLKTRVRANPFGIITVLLLLLHEGPFINPCIRGFAVNGRPNVMSVSYFDIFPDAAFSVEVNADERNKSEATPMQVRHLITYIVSQRALCPKWAIVQHQALCKYVFFAMFEGLDNSRFCKFKSELPAFQSLAGNGFPLIVLAEEQNYLLRPAVNTVVGYAFQPMKPIVYQSLEQMIPSISVLIDNGYPYPTDCEIPTFKYGPRCSRFGLEPLTVDQLAEYHHLPEKVDGARTAIAIDCEMVGTSLGDEVARLSATAEDGSVLLDEFFVTMGDMVDLRTSVSGITIEILTEKAKKPSTSAFESLSAFADQETIIIGHSLENDLRALKLIHVRVIDTALIYNVEVKPPRKPSLARLVAKHLQRPFREDQNGHDSVEDARASFELAVLAMREAVSEVRGEKTIPQLFYELLKSVAQVTVVAPGFTTSAYLDLDERIVIVNAEDTIEIANNFIEQMSDNIAPLTYAHFNALVRCEINEDEEREYCRQYNAALSQILLGLPKQSALVVYTGNGNMKRLRTVQGPDGRRVNFSEDPIRRAEMALVRQGLLWVKVRNAD
jgi:RNA exonuclease 1